MVKLTPKIVEVGTGASSPLSHSYFEVLHAAMVRYGILENRTRVAAFLVNIGVESGGLRQARESMNYSAAGLAATWPNRYAVKGKPNELALSLHRKPEAIANTTYANRMGNGSIASGDGWKYRGAGWIQTTGKENTKKVFRELGIPADTDPAVLTQPEFAALSAAFFWASNGCNELADKDYFSQTVKVVNGALPNDANEGALRKARYRACVAEIKKGE